MQDKGWVGLLDWEFAEKVASLIERAEDWWFKVHIMSFSSSFSKVIVSTKEILEKRLENQSQNGLQNTKGRSRYSYSEVCNTP